MRADMGGTDILSPLRAAQENYQYGYKKVIFILTDGDVNNKSAVINRAEKYNDTIRVNMFGLGGGCDEDFIRQVG